MSTALYVLPAIGAPWPGQGGIFAGLFRGPAGETRALILADAAPAGHFNWRAAMSWAAKLEADDHRDFALPSRTEGWLLCATLREQFDTGKWWYWLRDEANAESYCQHFFSGGSFYDVKGAKNRVRACRSFEPTPAPAAPEAEQPKEEAS